MDEKPKFLTTLKRYLHFKLFFALFSITLSGIKFNSTSAERDCHSGFRSGKECGDKFLSEILPVTPHCGGYIR